MVYLQHTDAAQPAFIPRSRSEVNGHLVLVLRNTVGLEIEVDTEVLDLNTSALYYRIAVALPEDATAGEYEYTLKDDAGILSQGVAIVGGLDRPTQTDNTITYEQTEL